MKTDCHIHMLFDSGYWKAAIDRHRHQPNTAFIRATLARYREKGYTYLRDGGDRWGAGAAARELAPEYGITYRTPLAPLCKAGHYGAFIGTTYENFSDYAALVKKARRDGADFIKIMISGLMDFDHAGVLTEVGLPAHEIRELSHIAHEEGFSVMAHCNGARTMEAAALAGVDSIEHGAYADPAALDTLIETGTVWVPTLSTVANLRGNGRFNEAAVCAIYETAAQNIRYFAAHGGLLAVGSDAGAWAVPHGMESEEALLTQLLGEGADHILSRGNHAIVEKF